MGLGRNLSAETVLAMDIIADGLVALFNGVYTTLSLFISPVALFLVVSGSSLVWLARLEVASLDRKAAKPEVGRH